MLIKIKADSGRRIAWTDRVNGYFHFLFKDETSENGYFRGNTKYFSGFTCNGKTLLKAKEIQVFPYGFRSLFENSFVDSALLIDEQAFYFATNAELEILNLQTELLFNETLSLENKEVQNNQKELDNFEKKEPVWTEKTIDSIKVISCNSGIAIASNFDFSFLVNDKNLSLCKKESTNNDMGVFKNSGWFVTFEDSEESAVQKAVRLAKQNGFTAHKNLIDSFLNNYSADFGDKKFNESIQWARFSAWLLATKDKVTGYQGIWAGLPWFRDNWGRDTFISLCGTLLISGCFEEAKNVLLGFAKFQNLDKDSSTYGRIPNRYRDSSDVIYNTADGTLWFIRALWEYVQYSGDFSVFKQLENTVNIALYAELEHCDEHGFLMHADADTWMDARIEGKEAISPRGNRANDVQALWFTALKIGSQMQRILGNNDKADSYDFIAERVKKSFLDFFWNKDCNALADCLPEGVYGEWIKDMRVRPNQLFTFMIPYALDLKPENYFVKQDVAEKIIKNVERELVNPFGLYSLSPEDPLFHPEHENPKWYHKDAAYHNGTIWEWNTGAYITAKALSSGGTLSEKPSAILQNYSKMILEYGCAGSLSENIHARPDNDGNPKLSGTFSQAWSLAEFNRNVTMDLFGFHPELLLKKIKLNPCLPFNCKKASAILPFGKGWKFSIKIVRKNNKYNCTVEWIVKNPDDLKADNFEELLLNDIKIKPNVKYVFKTPIVYNENNKKKSFFERFKSKKFETPEKWITSPFFKQNLYNEFCGAEHNKDYLFNLIKGGRMNSKCCGGKNTAALEWYFDSKEFEEKYHTNLTLGALYKNTETTFRLWAPTAKAVSISFFSDGEDSPAEKTVELKPLNQKGSLGVWETTVKGDLHGKYYLYTVLVHGVEQISTDPYATACGVNGNRSMVVDMTRTNPEGWENVKVPVVKSPCDVVAYEAHIADITSSPDWNGNKKNQRTFLGAAESGTTYDGSPTGFDHIKSLGVTHVQLLPVFDFRSIDEKTVNDPNVKNKTLFGNFNWGYDPENYACVEGSYSTNPYDGSVRIKEFKTLIKNYADAGIGIIMDVVYNHVKDGIHQGLATSVPGYFYRVEGYSGAGEDTASEHSMFRKYMVDTLSFWLKEYKICGFRFDLMGLHDVVTMNAIHDALHKIKKDVLLYGEGWDMYRAGKCEGASQVNCDKLNGIGFFNDAMRCGIKGPIFNDKQKGFVHDGSYKESIKFGIVGATNHPQVQYDKIQGTAAPKPWGKETWLSVNYTEIHDNITLHDKLFMVDQDKPEEYLDQMQKMAISLVLLAEGYPILHAGMEFCRSKEVPDDIRATKQIFYEYGISDDGRHFILHNTYNVCDKINNLDWKLCHKKQDVVNYVRNLIKLRKEHPAFRLSTEDECTKALHFIENQEVGLPEQVLAWELDGEKCGDSWKKIVIIANPFTSDVKFELNGKGSWHLVTDGKQFSNSENILSDGTVVTIFTKTVAIYALT